MNSRITLGVIGLTSEWFEDLEPRIRSNARLTVATMFEEPAARKRLLSRQERLKVTGAVQGMLRTPGLRAVICCRLGWRGEHMVRQVLERGLPVYLAASAVAELDGQVEQLLSQVEEAGGIVCPDLSWRYTPATLRLRELLATRLGPCRTIDIEVPEMSPAWLRTACDWSLLVSGTRGEPKGHRAAGAVHLELGKTDVRISTVERPVDDEAQSPPRPVWRIECERGRAVLTGETEITWQTEEDCHTEHLRDERSRLDVNLDLFFRRVAGGLIPTPSLTDVGRTETLLRSIAAAG
ncbi:hypothetical protein [Planctomyces sp. SH-PL14]|uniref:hypothetical protein n=1 Tax=Planctomyces sp. SH-PL14 TaxID=1632864 RepID=UPI00078E779F|nr:hypothetical protein [Planctomyces sp. SH-PL14]AMV21549.1 hypothetical protein VT03_26840 [Planctomyces sp. SH-PL14]